MSGARWLAVARMPLLLLAISCGSEGSGDENAVPTTTIPVDSSPPAVVGPVPSGGDGSVSAPMPPGDGTTNPDPSGSVPGPVPGATGEPNGPVPNGMPNEPENPLLNADVGTKVMHRLSNLEYDNTVRDLLGSELRFGASFVHEEAEGFDNIAAALSMSPRQVEGYFDAGRQLAEDVFATPALRERLVACTLDAQTLDCAQSTISNFGLRAFRRPLEPSELDWLLGVYQDAVELGETPDGAMQHVVHVVLSAPQFLYRIEFDPDPTDSTPHPLSGYELASRLSYALWASMPDESLFALAESGELALPATLEAQVDRMLAESGAETLATNFAGQWLGGVRLDEHSASADVYPDWSEELGQAMQREMELYFLKFLNEDLPYTDFLTADFNFVNPTLAAYYGLPAPQGTDFELVENTADERSGFVGLAGFLTHTSRETRSSPIIRGKWILDAMWCVSLKLPADAVVEPLPEPEEGAEPTTVRELIAAHRADPACSSCHNLIDPIGLSLEHYDGIGRYRAEYENGLSIESSAELPDGTVVDSLSTLSAALTAGAQFTPCATKKLNAYALGRLTTDTAYINDITTKWTARGLTLRNLIKASVTSETFLMRRAVTP